MIVMCAHISLKLFSAIILNLIISRIPYFYIMFGIKTLNNVKTSNTDEIVWFMV